MSEFPDEHDCYWRREAHLLTEERDRAIAVVEAVRWFFGQAELHDRYWVDTTTTRAENEVRKALLALDKTDSEQGE